MQCSTSQAAAGTSAVASSQPACGMGMPWQMHKYCQLVHIQGRHAPLLAAIAVWVLATWQARPAASQDAQIVYKLHLHMDCATDIGFSLWLLGRSMRSSIPCPPVGVLPAAPAALGLPLPARGCHPATGSQTSSCARPCLPCCCRPPSAATRPAPPSRHPTAPARPLARG
jgi:hypothetical protein